MNDITEEMYVGMIVGIIEMIDVDKCTFEECMKTLLEELLEKVSQELQE